MHTHITSGVFLDILTYLSKNLMSYVMERKSEEQQSGEQNAGNISPSGNKSPGNKSPTGNECPLGNKSPGNKSLGNKSPFLLGGEQKSRNKSPGIKSPGNKSPSAKTCLLFTLQYRKTIYFPKLPRTFGIAY